MFSNHSAPLNIEDGDRRYFVFNSKAQPRQDAYYDRLYGYLETPEAMNAIYTFLMKRDLSGFNPFRRPPMTEAKQQIIAESEHPLQRILSMRWLAVIFAANSVRSSHSMRFNAS